MEGVFLPRWLKKRFKTGLLVLFLLCLGAWSSNGFFESARLGAQDVQIWQEPSASDLPLLDAIEKSQKQIDIEMYLFTHTPLVKALVNAESRGVPVRLIIEDKPFGGARTPQKVLDGLTAGGVEIKKASQRFVFNHAKAVIIDDTAWIMTANWTKAAFLKNREILLKSHEADVVQEIQQLFENDWKDQIFVPTKSSSVVTSPETSRTAVRQLINKAQQEILLATEVWADEQMAGWLKEAEARGVRVKLLLPKEFEIAKDMWRPIETKFLSKPYLHEKIILVDEQRALVGSLNLSTNSFDQNREISILIDDKTALTKLSEWWRKDWQSAK